jgi:hypothetical protein
MQIIPLQSVPSQTVATLLSGQQCQLNIYQKDQGIFFDLTSNGVDMTIATIARNAVYLDPHASYDGFIGNFIFIDTQGLDDPFYTGLGARWQLVYLTAAEYAASLISPITAASITTAQILTLAATLEVTAPAGGGNYSVAHGQSSVPPLIEIIPTSQSATWAQINFADLVNVNLVGSDSGVTATVLVYVQSTATQVQTPAAVLAVTAPNAGNFVWPHGLGAVPSLIEILPTSNGAITVQTPDANTTDLLLVSSAAGNTALIYVYAPISGQINLRGAAAQLRVTAAAPGAFSVPHGLTATPSRIGIMQTSGGLISAQSVPVDSQNVNLSASATGITATVFVYA